MSDYCAIVPRKEDDIEVSADLADHHKVISDKEQTWDFLFLETNLPNFFKCLSLEHKYSSSIAGKRHAFASEGKSALVDCQFIVAKSFQQLTIWRIENGNLAGSGPCQEQIVIHCRQIVNLPVQILDVKLFRLKNEFGFGD